MKREKKVRQWNATQVENLILAIPDALMGRTSYRGRNIRSAFFSRFAHDVFAYWFDASIAKSDGVADEFGNKWKPIKTSTKIYRQLNKEERKRFKLKGTRGLLTSEEDKIWRRIFYFHYKTLSYWLSDKEAKEKAAKIAWSVLKKMGAKTKKREYASREPRILFASGRLINSLRPSSIGNSYYRPNKDQIASFDGPIIRLGTSVSYAQQANRDRPLVPNQVNVWGQRASKNAIKHVLDQIIGEIT